MIRVVAHNIISPLGNSSIENYNVIKQGVSSIKRYEDKYGITEPFCASLFNEDRDFQELAISSIDDATKTLDFNDKNILLVISTVKGNIADDEYASRLRDTLAGKWQAKVKVIVVSNACTSGVCAQIVAARALEMQDEGNSFDYAVVVGIEIMNKFIVSGFQSLKAVSDEACRPFDIERIGMNPGEAAATMVLQKVDEAKSTDWIYQAGEMANDGYHISSPSPVAEGASKALKVVLENIDTQDIVLVNAHGTATLYNDEMEAKAISQVGLMDVPVNSLKGYFGHTMGAAGVLETIVTMLSIDDGVILATKGYDEQGTSCKLNIYNENIFLADAEEKSCFIKMISGFGGINAAIVYSHKPVGRKDFSCVCQKVKSIDIDEKNCPSLKEVYKTRIADYPKFYKMDVLSQLGFVASELLLKEETEDDDCAIILFGQSGSKVVDELYRATIHADNYFPSPSLFVYTLPNIVCGEIALRHNFHGETLYIQMPEKDEELMMHIVKGSMLFGKMNHSIAGWINADSEKEYNCNLNIYINNNGIKRRTQKQGNRSFES